MPMTGEILSQQCPVSKVGTRTPSPPSSGVGGSRFRRRESCKNLSIHNPASQLRDRGSPRLGCKGSSANVAPLNYSKDDNRRTAGCMLI
ncbi:hypothetical protein CEXT_260061 [Caerostris extrusa]|uniref:Uncharacterized protein n=1 Tax=Caerostris extrusa TaxID=172846 RepID=A0AAV4VRB5_CAEEX|nr:hypothetical protein CEXT_260061 [Caerostris extrusa]